MSEAMRQSESGSAASARVSLAGESLLKTLESLQRDMLLIARHLEGNGYRVSVPADLRDGLPFGATLDSSIRKCVHDLHALTDAMAGEVAQRTALEKQLLVSQTVAEQYRHLAFHDPVTALPNRILLHDRLDRALAQARRHKRSFAVLFMDIDKFKDINDTFGHAAGDAILRLVANRLLACMRTEDTASRAGGDEFLCLLMEVNNKAAVTAVVECMVAQIAQGAGTVGFNCAVKLSIGCAMCPLDGVTPEVLLRNADKAMYSAKRLGTGLAFCDDHAAEMENRWQEIPTSSPTMRMPNGYRS